MIEQMSLGVGMDVEWPPAGYQESQRQRNRSSKKKQMTKRRQEATLSSKQQQIVEYTRVGPSKQAK